MRRGCYLTDIISVQCPKGHDMYPNGILAKTLWDNEGVRFRDCQEIVPPEWKRRGKIPRDDQPPLYKYGCYRFTEAQYEWVGVECKECAKGELKEKDY